MDIENTLDSFLSWEQSPYSSVNEMTFFTSGFMYSRAKHINSLPSSQGFLEIQKNQVSQEDPIKRNQKSDQTCILINV